MQKNITTLHLLLNALCLAASLLLTKSSSSNAFVFNSQKRFQDVQFQQKGDDDPFTRTNTYPGIHRGCHEKGIACLHLSKSITTHEANESTSLPFKESIRRVLIVGDGDLSFSAEFAKSNDDVSVAATVLESRTQHREVYLHSQSNEEDILNVTQINQNQVLYQVDATELHKTFVLGQDYFDVIQFNFPHWKGKANHKRNRQLLLDVFSSTKDFIRSAKSNTNEEGGALKIALVPSQGDIHAKSLQEFRETWMPTLFANQEGWVLTSVEDFQVQYRLSSHRGVDRGFRVGSHPDIYSFRYTGIGGKKDETVTRGERNETGIYVKEEHQLCCRHELHIVLPLGWKDTAIQDDSIINIKNIVEGDAIRDLVQGVALPGIRVRVPARSLLHAEDTGYESDMMVFLLVYCGEKLAITRETADSIRNAAELEVERHVALRENRRGRLVSRPFLFPLLDSIMEEHNAPIK